MNQRKKLFSVKNPYDHTGQALFLEACRENYAHQRNHCEDYKKLCDGLKSPSPEDLKDPAELPVIPTMLMKQHDFNAGGAIYTATSSGCSSLAWL